METIKIKYFSEDYPRVEKIEQGDWVDLRIDTIKDIEWNNAYFKNVEDEKIKNIGFKEYHEYKKGDVLFLGLGVAMKLPKGYEAHLLPRSSTFKKTGFILTNGVGVIDNLYCGDNDEWKVMVYCTRDGQINRYDRLFQFRIVENQPELNFVEVDKLDGEDRGGFGSTDVKENKNAVYDPVLNAYVYK